MEIPTEFIQVFPLIGSRIGGQIVYVRFYNLTQWPVDIIWMRSAATPTKYATLKKQQWIDIQTYEGHPWIFRRSLDGAPMVINQEEIFWPQPVARNYIVRNSLFITTPLMSLAELSARRLLLPGSTFDQNQFLGLPPRLKSLIITIKAQEKAYRASSVKIPMPVEPRNRPPPAAPNPGQR
ncbi:unnamed protein product [Caenorhabditis angaria]|uniref:von Hippel-Lindau disease tumour suppressor beta domain-containing protein n=1 Tax=Caenorhabditis angaria TaxID=860376 RepID=A0A9P1J437_9PELO|nr:unnamed protein product [Caenorhabditis angaria]